MAVIRGKQAHLWERDPHDWYVEPYECSAALFLAEEFDGPIWDPACGIGRIIEEAHAAGYKAVGSDLIARNSLCTSTSDFLFPNYTPIFRNIITNPPFRLAEDFVKRGIDILPEGGKLAVILPLVWLSGFSTKRDWLPYSPLKTVYSISPRPSMPPGKVIEAGIKPSNGTKDFAWLVWQKGHSGVASIKFLNTNTARKQRRGSILRAGGRSLEQGTKERTGSEQF